MLFAGADSLTKLFLVLLTFAYVENKKPEIGGLENH